MITLLLQYASRTSRELLINKKCQANRSALP